jgi:hypothetical protein
MQLFSKHHCKNEDSSCTVYACFTHLDYHYEKLVDASSVWRRRLFSIQLGKAALVAGKDHIVPRPRPSSKLRALVIPKGLLNLSVGIHDKGTVLFDRFLDGFTLQQEKLARSSSRLVHSQFNILISLDGQDYFGVNGLAIDFHGTGSTFNVKHITTHVSAGIGGGQCQCAPRLHSHVQNRHIVGRVGRSTVDGRRIILLHAKVLSRPDGDG